MNPQNYYAKIKKRYPRSIFYDQPSAAYVATTVNHAKTILRHVRPKAMAEIVVDHNDNVEGHRAAVAILNALFASMRNHGQCVIQKKFDHEHHRCSESEHLRQLISRSYRMNVSVDLMNEWLRPAVSRMMFDLAFGRDHKTWCKQLYQAAYDLVNFLDGKYLSEHEFVRGMSHLRYSLSEHLGVDWNAGGGILPAFCHFAVGHETPANVVANIIAHANEMHTPQARCISEAIRFDPPIQTLWRYIDTSFMIDGIQFKKNRKVCIHLGLASRDEVAFADPDVFSLMNNTEHTGMFFGSATKGCPGRHTAFDIARCLLDVIESLELHLVVENIVWLNNTDVRGMDRLMVRFAPIGS